MAITASGLFGITLKTALNNTIALDLEAEDMKVAMITDSATPDFDAHDFWADLSANEVSGTGYTAGGQLLATTTLTVGSPAAGQLKWDAVDAAWTTSTITSAMASVVYADAIASDPLVALHDFVTAASTTAGTFTIQWNTSGLAYFDYTP